MRKLNDGVRNIVVVIAVVLALALAFVFLRAKKRPDHDYGLVTESGRAAGQGDGSASGKVAAKNREDIKPQYADAASIRIANFVPPKSLENVYASLRSGLVDKSLTELEAMEKGILSPEEKIVVNYTKAQIFFTYKDFKIAKKMFEEFITANPTHPLVENAQNTIQFIDNYDKHMEQYKKFEDELKKNGG